MHVGKCVTLFSGSVFVCLLLFFCSRHLTWPWCHDNVMVRYQSTSDHLNCFFFFFFRVQCGQLQLVAMVSACAQHGGLPGCSHCGLHIIMAIRTGILRSDPCLQTTSHVRWHKTGACENSCIMLQTSLREFVKKRVSLVWHFKLLCDI